MSENTILSLDNRRGRRMTEEQAEEILKSEGFTRIVYSRVTTHRKRSAETVITLWESADFRRRARTTCTYSI